MHPEVAGDLSDRAFAVKNHLNCLSPKLRAELTSNPGHEKNLSRGTLSKNIDTPQGAHTVIGMVAAGVGLGLVPQSARFSAREDVVFIPLSPSVVAPPLSLVWRRDDERQVGRNFQAAVRDVGRLTARVRTGRELDQDFRAKLREQVGR